MIKMFATGGSEKSQKNAAGALSSIASKHPENRTVVARRIVNQLNSKVTPDVAMRIGMAVAAAVPAVTRPRRGSDGRRTCAQDRLLRLRALPRGHGRSTARTSRPLPMASQVWPPRRTPR